MKFEGSLVALITPMSEDGEVDYQALTRLIELHIESGTHGIVTVGTTGESSTLNVDEQHFKAIADAVPIAQILYNVPGRTVADMSNEIIARLAVIDNIVGCKDATGDLERGKALIDLCGHQLSILSGDDPTALEYMKLGARGDVSVTANVAPKLMSDMCSAALAGDFDLAEKIDAKLRGLHTELFIESNPIPVKYAVSKMGYTANKLRLPLTSLSLELEAQVDEAIKQAG